ncbi:lysylphosphatidylglycerol synthase domain-containing protein [Candidatus Electronema sp. JC]|uniref:lysylphosphatidylglycerol synthase domain-containing protein n=1 Tax=Candidatus Electronema sp. JC TaxID=3401570 RepID=UPI003B433C0B
MKSKLKYLCYIALSVFLIAWIMYSFKEGKELVKTTKNISCLYFIPQFICIFLTNVLNSYLNMSLIQHFGLKLFWKEWLPLGFVNSLANLIFPATTGTMIKAVYLKKKYNFAITKNFSLLLFATFITYLNLFFLTGISLFFMKKIYNDNVININNLIPNSPIPFFDLLTTGMFAMTTIGLIILLILKLIRHNGYSCQKHTRTRDINFALLLLQGSMELSSSKTIAVKIFICTSLSYFIRLGMLHWGFLAVDAHLNISQLIFINLFFSLQSFVNFLPGNIGIQEVVITISSGVIGGDFSDGLIVAAIIRLASLIEIFLFGFLSYKILNVSAFLNQKTAGLSNNN